MERRRFLQLGMVMGGTIILGGVHRFGRSLASAAGTAIPTVDQLIMTNTVDNIYNIFAKGGKMGDVMVQRTPLPSPMGSAPMLLAEFGLAFTGIGQGGRAERRSCWTSRCSNGVSPTITRCSRSIRPKPRR